MINARPDWRLRALALVAIVALLIAACSGSTGGTPEPIGDRNGVPLYRADQPCENGRPDEAGLIFPASDAYLDPSPLRWPTATPEWVGLDGALLDEAASAVELAPRVTSLLVIRHGRLVMERYFNGADAATARNPHSATKSLIALLVGIAIEDGYLSLDDEIGDLVPDVVAGSPVAGVTVEDMLAMQAGLEWIYDAPSVEYPTTIESVLHAPAIAEPGTVFEYNSGLSDLLALTLDRLVPGGLCRYAHSRLFTPLGIDVDHWHENPEGSVTGGNSAFMTPRELARIGQLVLDDGAVGGRQLVSSDWLATMLDPRYELPVPYMRRDGVGVAYALHWWVYDVGDVQVWTASGYGGQNILVIPSLDMVMVITHDTATIPDRQVIWEDVLRLFVLPAAGHTVPCPCPPDLYRAHLDGSGREPLAPHRGSELASDWSPNGDRIVFHSFRDLNAELYVMNADGSGLQRLTYSWALEAAARWSADGTRLAFLSDGAADELINSPIIDVHIIDLATGAITPATEGLGDVRALDWDPSGSRIAFIRGGFNGLGELWVVDLGSGETELLFAGPVGLPAWSPDGTSIAVELGYGTSGSPRVGLLDLATLTIDTVGPGTLPSWSGDGTRLYVTIDGETLVEYDLATGVATDLGPMPYGVVSPDGEWIVFGAPPE